MCLCVKAAARGSSLCARGWLVAGKACSPAGSHAHVPAACGGQQHPAPGLRQRGGAEDRTCIAGRFAKPYALIQIGLIINKYSENTLLLLHYFRSTNLLFKDTPVTKNNNFRFISSRHLDTVVWSLVRLLPVK